MYWSDPSEFSIVIGCAQHFECRSLVFTESQRTRWIVHHQATWHAPMPTARQLAMMEPDL